MIYLCFCVTGTLKLMDSSEQLLWSVQVDHQLFALQKLDVTVGLCVCLFVYVFQSYEGSYSVTTVGTGFNDQTSFKINLIKSSQRLLKSRLLEKNSHQKVSHELVE